MEKVDPEGYYTEYEYNHYNQVTKIIDHYEKETLYEYGVNRNLTRKSYDLVGNWVSTTQNGTYETRAANGDNEYTSITGMSPQYDANGNLTFDGTRQYVYGWANVQKGSNLYS